MAGGGIRCFAGPDPLLPRSLQPFCEPMTDTEVFRPEARAPRGFQDRRARDLRAERSLLARVSAVYESCLLYTSDAADE